MEQLAEKYAKLKGTKVIAAVITGNALTFVLESGQKHTMSTRQLEEAIAELEAGSVGGLPPASAESGSAAPEKPRARSRKGAQPE